MKKSFYFLVLFSVAIGCTRPDVTSPLEDAQTQSQATQSLLVNSPATLAGLEVKLLEVNDSRCPMNAMCIRQGSAVVQVQLKHPSGAGKNQVLYLDDALSAPDNRGNRAADTVSVTLSGKMYQLILSDVQPYPNTSDPQPAPKKATLSVKPL